MASATADREQLERCCCAAASARWRPTGPAAPTAGAPRSRASRCTCTAAAPRGTVCELCSSAATTRRRASRPPRRARPRRAPRRATWRDRARLLAAAARLSGRGSPPRPRRRIDSGRALDPVSVSIVVSAPREQVFDYLQDIANHAEFTDHFLVDWHLTRIDSVGRGAGARFRVKAPGNRFSWADVTFVRGGPPAPDRRGRAHRQEQPHPHARRLRAAPRRRRATRVTLHLPDRAGDLRGPARREPRRALVDQTQERPRAAAPARDPRAKARAAGAARDRCRWVDCRLACDAACASAALAALALLAVLALAACGDSHTRVTTGTYAGESGANAPYLNVGPLIYEVQISRELNPWNNGDSTYLQGLAPAQRQLAPGPGVVRGLRAGLQQHHQTAASPPTADHAHRHPGEHLPADPAGPTNLFAYRGGHGARQRPAPAPRHPAAHGSAPGRAAAVQDRDVSLDNRPLELKIINPENPPSSATAELDV